MRLAKLILILLLNLPLAALLTFAMTPVWRWIEAKWRIEAIGHSGPADWCFLAVFAALALATICLAWRPLAPKGQQ